MTEYLYQILLPLPFDYPFTYKSHTQLKIGDIVKVPFRNKELIGSVWAEEDRRNIHYKLKEIIEIYKIFPLSHNMITFITKVAEYNMIPLGSVLKMTLNTPEVFLKQKEIIPYQHIFNPNLVKPNPSQQSTLELIQKNKDVSVLHGVTGSGKTEVYLHLIADVIKNRGQVLLLLPEITLTSQLVQRFEQRFHEACLQWHSQLTPKNRKMNWLNIAKGNAKFIVGARSALFLNYQNLQLIIIDEEHDHSFKQEEQPIYHARDMAILKSKIENIPIVLTSATPSIETLHNVTLGKYKYYTLENRFKNASMPEINITDLRKNKEDGMHCISKLLKKKIEDALQREEQVLLFLNKRGYSSLTICTSCFSKVECPDCNFYLVKHQKHNKLQCHYCGFSIYEPKCKSCNDNTEIKSIGIGVERVLEEVKKLFPSARNIIISSDTASGYKKISEAMDQISNHQVDIIIGTQMITKGLHFSKINLVGIIDADSSMVSTDPRAIEKTYQVLQQVSGRAGRESNKSEVVIQTYNPKNIILQTIVEYDFQTFLEIEKRDREIAQMPPFRRLAMIKATSLNEEALKKYMNLLVRNAPIDDRIQILGPSPAPVTMIRKRYRYRILINADKSINIQNIIKKWIADSTPPRNIRISVDIDPYHFQ